MYLLQTAAQSHWNPEIWHEAEQTNLSGAIFALFTIFYKLTT